MKIFSEEISVFKNYRSKPKTITLGQWLKVCKGGSRFTEQVLQYRRCLNELIDKGYSLDEAKKELKNTGKNQLKKSLPLVTVGAICSNARKQENVVTRTGWIALDIDVEDNPHLTDAEHLRDEVAKIQNVAFSALSTGGRGVWALVKVSQPKRQAEHFEALQADFKAFGITLDSSKGKNPNDARFYSYDPGAIIKDSFTVYKKFPPEKKPRRSKKRARTEHTGDVFDFAMQKVKDKHGYTFTHPGDMHHSIYHFCSVLNWAGVPKHEAESWININLLPLSEIKSNCITGAYDTPEAKRYFGAGKKDYSQRVNHAPRRDSAGERKIQSRNSTPNGFNPYTGEIFDKRGYPADWDEIEAPEPGTAEYAEAEYYRAMDADPILKQIDEIFEPDRKSVV